MEKSFTGHWTSIMIDILAILHLSYHKLIIKENPIQRNPNTVNGLDRKRNWMIVPDNLPNKNLKRKQTKWKWTVEKQLENDAGRWWIRWMAIINYYYDWNPINFAFAVWVSWKP